MHESLATLVGHVVKLEENKVIKYKELQVLKQEQGCFDKQLLALSDDSMEETAFKKGVCQLELLVHNPWDFYDSFKFVTRHDSFYFSTLHLK